MEKLPISQAPKDGRPVFVEGRYYPMRVYRTWAFYILNSQGEGEWRETGLEGPSLSSVEYFFPNPLWRTMLYLISESVIPFGLEGVWSRMAILKEEARILVDLPHVSVVGNKSFARAMSEPLQIEILGNKTQVIPQPGDALLCMKEEIDGMDHNYALLTYITNLNDHHILSPQGVEYVKQMGCGVLPPFEFAALLHADGYSTIGMWLDIACGLSVRTDAADLARRAYLKATGAKDPHNPLA